MQYVAIPFNTTSSGVLKIPEMLPQTTLEIPNEHSSMLSLTVNKSIEQVTEMTVFSITSRQVPQLDSTLYWSVEQLESTVVQLKISCSGLIPTNWMLVGGGGVSDLRNSNKFIIIKIIAQSHNLLFQLLLSQQLFPSHWDRGKHTQLFDQVHAR